MSDSLRPTDCSMPGLSVHQQLTEFTQAHVRWVGDAIQPSRPLLPPSPSAFNVSQHQGLFQWVGSLHQVAKPIYCKVLFFFFFIPLRHKVSCWFDIFQHLPALNCSLSMVFTVSHKIWYAVSSFLCISRCFTVCLWFLIWPIDYLKSVLFNFHIFGCFFFSSFLSITDL